MVCFKNTIVNTLHKGDNKDDDDDDNNNNNNNNNTCIGVGMETDPDGEMNGTPNQELKKKNCKATKISRRRNK